MSVMIEGSEGMMWSVSVNKLEGGGSLGPQAPAKAENYPEPHPEGKRYTTRGTHQG